MQPDNVALCMILMAALTVVVLLIFGQNPLKYSNVKKRIAAALVVGFIAFMVLAASVVRSYCIGFPKMGDQLVLPTICIISVIIFVKRKFIIVVSCIVLFYNGGRLGAEFYELIRHSDEYVATDYKNRPISKSCEDFRSDVTASKLWHSWFTGIYGIRR